ncbi:MAG TPA: hypothetical protein PLL78_07950 [Fimbriimonadaceae bacterium]|nr:hypothetical protein [Fimbriimonadaceae bacterium]HRJ96607.1 hypothetical protein [Fimbriimonadaceae bacterium]
MSRGPIPGRAGLIVLAAAAVPIVISAAKPLAKAIGRGLSKIGEKLQEAADEAKPKSETTAQAKPATKAEKTAAEEPKAETPSASASQAETEAGPRQVEEAKTAKKSAKAKARPKTQAAKTKRKGGTPNDDFETA